MKKIKMVQYRLLKPPTQEFTILVPAFMTAYLLGLGFILGLKHSLDADHLVAITTLVSEKRSLISTSLVGVLWGIGHTSILLLTGIVVLAIDMKVPETVALGIEFLVALVLIAMGLNVMRKLAGGGKVHHHPHRHGEVLHTHPHVHSHGTGHDATAHSHSRTRRTSMTSLFLGMLHGLAGSAGLMLLVTATIKDFWVGVTYICVFGIGSTGGMWIMSMLVGLPFLLTEGRFRLAHTAIRAAAGIASILVGVFIGWEIGLAGGWLG